VKCKYCKGEVGWLYEWVGIRTCLECGGARERVKKLKDREMREAYFK